MLVHTLCPTTSSIYQNETTNRPGVLNSSTPQKHLGLHPPGNNLMWVTKIINHRPVHNVYRWYKPFPMAKRGRGNCCCSSRIREQSILHSPWITQRSGSSLGFCEPQTVHPISTVMCDDVSHKVARHFQNGRVYN